MCVCLQRHVLCRRVCLQIHVDSISKLNWYIVKYYRAYLGSLLDNGPKVLRISALIIILCSWNFRKILLVSVNCKVEFFPKAYFMCLNYILPYI